MSTPRIGRPTWGEAARWLHEHGIPVTFFVPSALFEHPGFRPYIVALPSLGFEVGSHGHRHDFTEIRVLMRGAGPLSTSCGAPMTSIRTFGHAPVSFRSPAWCPLGRGAVELLVALGYRIDSSATPQRLPIFSSTPYANTWVFARAACTSWLLVCWKSLLPVSCCRPPRRPS